MCAASSTSDAVFYYLLGSYGRNVKFFVVFSSTELFRLLLVPSAVFGPYGSELIISRVNQQLLRTKKKRCAGTVVENAFCEPQKEAVDKLSSSLDEIEPIVEAGAPS